MKRAEKIVFVVTVLILVGLVGLHLFAKEALLDRSFSSTSSANLITGAAIANTGEVSLAASIQSGSNCWSYTTNTSCDAADCLWKSDSWGSSCQELSCWNLYSQSDCQSTTVPGKNCTWQGGGLSYGCERLSCWSLSGTSNATCEGNSLGLSCGWSDYCQSTGSGYATDCWSKTNESSCEASSGCSWGSCNDKSCWSYTTNTTCAAAKDPWSGKACGWSNNNCNMQSCSQLATQNACSASSLGCQWKWNSCQDTDCYTWDYTNASTCVNNTANLSCSWSGSYCMKQDCWSYNSNNTCSGQSNCVWKTYQSSGWCNEVQCYSWDSWSGGNQTACVNNTYGMDCVWSGNPPGNATNGWCNQDWSEVSCVNMTSERECMDTTYCWWQYQDWNNVSAGGTCNEPGSFGAGTSVGNFVEWNPGCYLFDMNSTDCEKIFGCDYSGGLCISAADAYGANITANGINCSYVNDSSLCNSIAMLSSCCAWQNSSCTANKMSSACKDQMQATPIGASFCEDYNAYTSQSICEQIAGSPWYMPCSWDNTTSHCGFKASNVFGNESQNLMKIDNKKNCEAANGKWITENYCEGNVSVPSGRCEYKFNEETNCDKACFACESRDSDGNSVNASNAQSACVGSKSGMCEYEANANAPNGIGICKAKDQFKKGVVSNCDDNCGDCTFKGDSNNNDTTKRPSYYCSNSKANSAGGGCKWVSDSSASQGGICLNKGDKICEDACDRCNNQDDCSNLGRTAVSNVSGSCKWQGDSNDGSCVANVAGDVEICWDGIDNTDDDLIDCADSSCYADSYCGFVSGDCWGWTTNTTCITNDCEWVNDTWNPTGWCDFKGSQCWNLKQNSSVCNTNTNCEWTNDSMGQGWCEQDWSKQETCMNLNSSNCAVAVGQGCTWTNDTWCNGNGANSTWCTTGLGGWCDNTNFEYKNCYVNSGSSACNVASGCSWHVDDQSQPQCEVNWSTNCWNNMDNSSCSTAGCFWNTDNWGSWCSNKADQCWDKNTPSACTAVSGNVCTWSDWSNNCQPACYGDGVWNNQSACSAVSICSWKAEAGWCEESGGCWNMDTVTCSNATGQAAGCRWKEPGWCDPKGGGFSGAANSQGGGGSMGQCYKYDGNESLCTNSSAINMSCGFTPAFESTCDVNFMSDCWRYDSIVSGCNVTNGCWFKNDTWGSMCVNSMDQCFMNESYQSWSNPGGWQAACNANTLCANTSWNSCEPKCFSQETANDCTGGALAGKCSWTTGWCNPAGMTKMFNGMENGAPTPLGMDTCGESGMQASVDVCGFGMKDMGNAYGFGLGVVDFSNASTCNGEQLSSFVMGMAEDHGSGGGPMSVETNFGQARTGDGTDTVAFTVYLDTDGSTSGGCALPYNSTAVGYEFRFRYSAVWNSTLNSAVETFNAYKCGNSDWKATDIKLSAWKKKMCSDIGGPMIAVDKADLEKFPSLYNSSADLRVAVATIGNTGNVTSPTDSAGPGWATPGAIDFEIQDAFSYGANSAKFEDILKDGFVKGEDCFSSADDDNDGNVNCYDWDCQYFSNCTNTGVNDPNYVDSSSPLVTGVKIEEYPDAALIAYDTSKPANGTLELYGADSQCLNQTDLIYDIGILNVNVRDYKLWHYAMIYNDGSNSSNISLNYPLASGVTYYYKLKVCDTGGKCAISKCSSFKTPLSVNKCGYCNFVTRIKTPTGWNVSYDVNRDGTYEHLQGQVCGPNAGMKTNYTTGRKVNIRLTSANSYIEFLNATLTKGGLNDKVRTVSDNGSIMGDDEDYVGLTSQTRDKIINSLHPEACRVKIPFSGTCNAIYHCDDNGANCEDKTAESVLLNATECLWQIPYCEFSTYREATGSSNPPPSSSTSSGGGGGSSGACAEGYTRVNTKCVKNEVPAPAATPMPSVETSTGTEESVETGETTDSVSEAAAPQETGASTEAGSALAGKAFGTGFGTILTDLSWLWITIVIVGVIVVIGIYIYKKKQE